MNARQEPSSSSEGEGHACIRFHPVPAVLPFAVLDNGRGYAFPCDATGHVDLDGMTERARNNYFFARAMVGRDLSVPAVEQATLH